MEIKFFIKKQFYAFLASFFITFIVGIFIWNVFTNSNNYIFVFNQALGQASEIGYKIFPAAILPRPEIENIITAAESEKEINLIEINDQEKPAKEAPAFVPPERDFSEAKQDLLDDIQEKLDIIQQQVNELIAQKLEEEEKDKDKEKTQEDEIKESEKLPDKPVKKTQVSSDGGATPIIYPKILISEIQISPIEQRFVKLYNPNNYEVNLTGWYLQRKTATGSDYSSFATKNDFENKTILASGYFLISRSLPNSDILIDDLTITENNSFALKNPSREISDELVLTNFPILPDNSPVADTTPPTGTVTINNGALYTNSRNVVLTIFATDNMLEVVEMKIANYNSYHDWEPYATSKNWELSVANGTKTVRVKFKDSAGNETAVGVSDTIILDTGLNTGSDDYFSNL